MVNNKNPNSKFEYIDILVLMATGGEGNQSQIQLGYGGCVWGTGRVTACPPGPGGTTQRSSVGVTVSDSDELHQSGRHGEEDVTQSPPSWTTGSV